MITSEKKIKETFVFNETYSQYFPMVKRFVLKNNGTITDAEDIFQETMIVLLEKLRQDNFVLTATLKTYVMAIAKNLWLKKLNAPKQAFSLSDISDESAFFAQMDIAIEQEQTYWDKFQMVFQKITQHCQNLIQDWFFTKLSTEDIQQKYGYTTKHNAQNQKYKCLNQIKKEHRKEE